ncbi:quinolinate synthase NadA [Candidatus Bathyarchaeota archaeon]|nr:quinolinate synthase NadA [Candidatus Bathyarchaeota archaeon]
MLNDLQRRILELKEEKNAVLLVHNYQIPEIQDIGDYLGDSLQLCRQAQRVRDAELIVFCGVDFMAETAAILNPDKKVVIPSQRACCPMAAMLPVERLRELKRLHPGAEVWAHPECEPKFQDRADFVLSTGGMAKRAVESEAEVFIVGTEVGMVDRLSREHPHKTFLPAKKFAECAAMKRINLDNLYEALHREQHVVTVPEEIADKARVSIERMLKMS